MNITNEKLYEMIVEFKSEITTEIAELKSQQAELKVAQSELRADISKWGVVLFIGSIIAMTSILGVFVASIMLTVA